MEITLRIYNNLNDELTIIANYTGIPKTALILYAINHGLTYGISTDLEMDYKIKDSVRLTCRIPEHLKEQLDNSTLLPRKSVNKLINLFIYNMLANHWLEYSNKAKATK